MNNRAPHLRPEIPLDMGCLVLQYIDDDHRVLGVVADVSMSEHLSRDERNRCAKSPGEHHILLVLREFTDYSEDWSIFTPKREPFPRYLAAEASKATPTSLSEEIRLLQLHAEEGVSRGLSWGRLRRAMFGFTAERREAIELAVLVEHYMSGGTLGNVPTWIALGAPIVARVMKELCCALPNHLSVQAVG